MGRPTDLDASTKDMLGECIAKGMPVSRACQMVGISRQTFYAWKRRGEAGEQPYADFVDAIAAAEAECQERCINAIQLAADADPTKGWRGVAWILERRFPDEWGQTLTIRVQAEVEKALGDFLAECRNELAPGEWEKVKRVAERMGERVGAGDRDESRTH